MVNWLDDQEILRAIADEVIETLVSEAAHAVAPAANRVPVRASRVQAAPIDEAVLNAWVDDVLEELTAELASPAPAAPLPSRSHHPASLMLIVDAAMSRPPANPPHGACFSRTHEVSGATSDSG